MLKGQRAVEYSLEWGAEWGRKGGSQMGTRQVVSGLGLFTESGIGTIAMDAG